MKQIRALGISQVGLPFELDVSVTLEGMGWALGQRQQKERVPLGLWSQFWNPHTSAPPSSVHNAFPVRAPPKGTAYYIKNFLSFQGWVENLFHQPISAMAQKSHTGLRSMLVCSRGAPCPTAHCL